MASKFTKFMEKNLQEQLKRLRTEYSRINPGQSWVASNRSKLMGQLNNTTIETRNTGKINFHFIYQFCSALVPNQLYLVVKPVIAIALIGAIATSGWIASASATENCLPGEVCYGVKMAAEKTQAAMVAMTGTQKDKAKLHLEFASRRAKEAKKVMEVKKSDAPKQAQVAIQKLEESIQTVNNAIKAVKEDKPEQIMEVKQEVEKKTDEIKQTLKEVDETSGGVGVSEATKIVKDTNLAATEAVVVTKEAGKVEVSDADVKIMVEKAISDTLSDGGDVKEQAEITTEMAKQIQQPIVVIPAPEIIFSSSTPTSTIVVPSITTPTSTTRASVKIVVDLATKQVEETKKDLETAKELVNNNQLFEAMQAVKTATDATSKASQAVQQIKTAVEVVTEKVIDSVASSTIVIVVNTSTPVIVTSTTNTVKVNSK